MKKRAGVLAMALCLILLCGCGSFLNRSYSSVTPHSSSYFSSEDPSALRADNYQELVNALLLLVGSHATEGTVWLYPSADTADPAVAAERACREVQQDTPMGAYAVEYLTYTIDAVAHHHNVLSLTVGYRRTAEQVAAMVHTTSVSALYDLLTAAANGGAEELTVQVSAFDQPREEVRDGVARLQAQLLAPEETVEDGQEIVLPPDVTPWQVYFYPATGEAGIIEILLNKTQIEG